ncbi:LSU ribosomal protein L30p (L7e) [Kocuria palustris PEL]|uniref:Large ribosomal subunit protein uL30 n=2 Tax=Micrococcaceae TaxID=1268 RepID=M2XY43_9MICC|nr:LSU ribosomal protein L30p (L7e) [Kocuria palustris PEL]
MMTTPKRIKADGRDIRITQTRSVVGQKQNMRDTLRSLGLKRPGNVVVRKADEVTVGMVNTAAHLVQVEEA